MLMLSQAPAIGGLSTRRRSPTALPPLPPFSKTRTPLFSKCCPLPSSRRCPDRNLRLTVNSSSAADGPGETGNAAAARPTASSPPSSRPFPGGGETVFVGEKGVPLEGVIQFDRPRTASRLESWGRVALLAGGDVLFLLVFSAIGRFNHGLPVLDMETLRTADPFIAGWFLGAYFLGGYGDDGKGVNGRPKAVLAAAKAWAAGIPLSDAFLGKYPFFFFFPDGLLIRSFALGHTPPVNFVLITMGTTGVLLIGWRALLYTFSKQARQEERRLLTSLVRRW
ncbi:unnamed protein product [Spirodela intermedia]|uniref:Uncharacterized protein n=1 Tax=Spirodela intermedia TaxID=51605 RepID=A0A7I8I7I1_SPIIN|nr:unnamed protein product [Spirodela intermedia]CAA6653479.1 unnamed protein product [Spirodela intermedia]